MQYESQEHCARLARLLADVIESDTRVVDDIALAFNALQAAVANLAVDSRLGRLVPVGAVPWNNPACDHQDDMRDEFPFSPN